jgi:hypothetical protein
LALAAVVTAVTISAFVGAYHWEMLRAKGQDSALAALLSPLDGQPSLAEDVRVLRSNPPVRPRADLVATLIRDRVPSGAPLLVLVDPDLTTEILVRVGRSNVLAISAPTQDGLVAGRRASIIAAVRNVPCGTYVVTQTASFRVGPGTELGGALTNGVLDSLREAFVFDRMAAELGYVVDRLSC